MMWNTDLLGINPGIFSNNIIIYNGNNIVQITGCFQTII